MAPLRVLCIHGYRQNGGSFREKTGALRKLLKKQVELVYMTAPHSVQQPSTEGESTKHNARNCKKFIDFHGIYCTDVYTRSYFTFLLCLTLLTFTTISYTL